MKYYDEVLKYEVLPKEELDRLFAKRDDISKEKIINHNLRLVIKIARTFMGSGLDLEDLISVGNIGLMEAVDKYKIEKGMFSTYASYWIKAYIKRALDKSHIVYHGSYDRMKDKEYHEISLDAPVKDDDESNSESFYNFINGTDDTFEKMDQKEELLRLIKNMKNILTEMEYIILQERYLSEEQMKFRDIAKKYHYSPQRVEQLEKRALKKLRDYMQD